MTPNERLGVALAALVFAVIVTWLLLGIGQQLLREPVVVDRAPAGADP